MPPAPEDVVYGIGRIDASGRIADRTVTSALGWSGGDRLTLTADAGVVTARRDPGGMITLPARAYIAIPAALRRRCGLRPGDRVLLAAAPAADTLTAYSSRRGGPGHPRPRRVPARARSTADDHHLRLPPAASQQAAVDAALLILERMGLSPDDLTAAPRQRPPVPTFADYVPVVSATVTGGTRKAYGSYWNRVVEQWGTRRLDEPTPSEIKQLVAYVRANTVPRRNARGGRSAAENLIAALRCLYKHAEEDGFISERDNPARKVAKPRRLPSTRRAVADTRLAEINQVAATTGDDPELDTLILRLHTETACRRGGALALRPADLDREQCLVLLREKGETVRWQPVSPTLMAALVRHAEERHAPPDGRLLRYTRRAAGHLPPLRRPVGSHRPAPALGPHPAGQHPLAPPHHLDLGGAQLRVRSRPRLRRAHRRHGRHRQRHVDVRARHPHRGRRCPRGADRRTAPTRGAGAEASRAAPAESPAARHSPGLRPTRLRSRSGP